MWTWELPSFLLLSSTPWLFYWWQFWRGSRRNEGGGKGALRGPILAVSTDVTVAISSMHAHGEGKVSDVSGVTPPDEKISFDAL